MYAPNLPDYTTADGRMLTTIQFAIDAGYRDRKGEELENRKRESIEAGIPVHTRPAVGLQKRRDKRLEHHPRTGPIVREAFERRARGDGPTAVGAFLESHRVNTSQGSRTWSKQAVYNMIQNPIYKGVLRYGKDDRYVNANAVVGGPLVDPATWEAAQHPNGRTLHAPKSGESAWLVAGVLRCHACRYAMQGTTTSRGKRIYRCNRRHAGGVCPDPARIDADTIEAAAVEAFWTLTADLEAVGVPDAGGELEALEAVLEGADQRLAQVEDPAAQDAFGDRYLAVVRERREARDRAREAVGHARAAASANGNGIPSTDTLRAAWERMGVQDRRELLGLRFHALALRRDLSLVVWPAGADVDLPRRGFKQAPRLAAFPKPPASARSLAL